MATNRITIMQGNTYKLRLTYRENGYQCAVPQGYDMIAGLYTTKGQLVLSAKLSAGTIYRDPKAEEPIYLWEVSHADSVNLIGAYTVEVSVVDSNLTEVYHATSLVTLDFVERRNNSLLTT